MSSGFFISTDGVNFQEIEAKAVHFGTKDEEKTPNYTRCTVECSFKIRRKQQVKLCQMLEVLKNPKCTYKSNRNVTRNRTKKKCR